MSVKPFLKWAGGKRWIIGREEFTLPTFSGKYIEPFLGGGAVFFHHNPPKAVLSDLNPRLIETYQAIKDDWQSVWTTLSRFQSLHSKDFYYQERDRVRRQPHSRAAQFIYLNRACWNGLYRVNLRGFFNVPIGTKSKVIFEFDDFEGIAKCLQNASLLSCDFQETIDLAGEDDLLFVDPPYTTAHNFNGFVKYNEKLFSWEDQKRLKISCMQAADRGATVIISNADHQSVWDLYGDASSISRISRGSVISGSTSGRRQTAELLIRLSAE